MANGALRRGGGKRRLRRHQKVPQHLLPQKREGKKVPKSGVSEAPFVIGGVKKVGRRRSTFGGWEMGTGKERMVQSDFRHHAASLFLLLSHPELCTNPCRPISRRFPRIRSQLLQRGSARFKAERSIEAFLKTEGRGGSSRHFKPRKFGGASPVGWPGMDWSIFEGGLGFLEVL